MKAGGQRVKMRTTDALLKPAGREHAFIWERLRETVMCMTWTHLNHLLYWHRRGTLR